MKTIDSDTPKGRVHINQSTGLPAKLVSPIALWPSNFESPLGWQDTSWDEMTPEERKLYKRQYPVV